MPQLAALARPTPPPGDDWLHEIKLDGYRIGCLIEPGGDGRPCATLFTRQGNDWTTSFPEVHAAAVGLPARSALLDGEVSVLLADGRTSFHGLQRALAGGSQSG